MATYYIGADVHSNNTELAVEYKGNRVKILRTNYNTSNQQCACFAPG